jgi:integrase
VTTNNSSKAKKVFDSYTKYALSDQEIQRCLAKCNTMEKELLIRLGVFFGFRRDDMRMLEFANVDFVNKQITYREEKKDRLRTLPMDDTISLVIERYKNTLPKGAKYIFPARVKDKSRLGIEPIGSVTLYRLFQEILKDAEIPNPAGRTGRPFHALRGTCVKAWKRKGMDVTQVAEILGDTVDTVMLHYSKATMSEVKDTMERLK